MHGDHVLVFILAMLLRGTPKHIAWWPGKEPQNRARRRGHAFVSHHQMRGRRWNSPDSYSRFL